MTNNFLQILQNFLEKNFKIFLYNILTLKFLYILFKIVWKIYLYFLQTEKFPTYVFWISSKLLRLSFCDKYEGCLYCVYVGLCVFIVLINISAHVITKIVLSCSYNDMLALNLNTTADTPQLVFHFLLVCRSSLCNRKQFVNCRTHKCIHTLIWT